MLKKKLLSLSWKVCVVALGVGILAQGFFGARSSTPVVQAAPLLEKVQALGELHAVKYTYRDIHEFQTSKEPSGWVSVLPGGNEVVKAATLNSATMSFTGTVEAGVDLSKARVERNVNGSQAIILPPPQVYKPNVSAQVHGIKRGLFWRDANLSVDGIEDAKRRFRETSIQQGILDEAKKNVRTQVSALASDLGSQSIEVKFENETS